MYNKKINKQGNEDMHVLSSGKVWEEEIVVLGIEYFYIGKNIYVVYLLKHSHYFIASIYFPWNWRWSVDHSVYL